MNILITGATGVVGSALIDCLADRPGFSINAVVRNNFSVFPAGVKTSQIVDLGPDNDWSVVLRGIDVVIHAAARTHLACAGSNDAATALRRVNVEGTLNLAHQAVAAGVKRFIFISTIKVHGEVSELDHPFNEDSPLTPQGGYAFSKAEAEQGLQQLACETGMEVVIIRPPLVYGYGVKANFHSMMCWLDKGIPLPLGAIHNKRSLVALDNLVDLIVTCIDHPAAVNQIFLVADGEDLSTPDLLRRMAVAMEKPLYLIPVPVRGLELGASLFGKREIFRRLCGSLQVDISKTQQLLDWKPPISVDQGLEKTAKGFINSVATSRKKKKRLLRWFDILFSLFGLFIFSPLWLLIALVGLFDTGSPVFFQERVGRHRKSFVLVKFRTMSRDTVSVASHLVHGDAVTSWGRFLRRTKLDELPQLWNVLQGTMSLVGPRPCLFNQHELIAERECRDVFAVRPGITGLAQIKGIDMSTPQLLAEIDAQMIQTLTVRTYFSYIVKTILGQGRGDRVRR